VPLRRPLLTVAHILAWADTHPARTFGDAHERQPLTTGRPAFFRPNHGCRDDSSCFTSSVGENDGLTPTPEEPICHATP
jgi:hypothetical protein